MPTVCVECGVKAPVAYRWYTDLAVKLVQCENCGQNVDKYVEFDGVLVSLDVLLHRKPAFRHVIFNAQFDYCWKLGIVFLICASYTRWSSSRLAEKDGVVEDIPAAAHHLDALLLYAMELKFYLMFLLSALDLFVFIVSAVFLARRCSSASDVSFPLFARGLVLFSYARLVAVPLLIWGETETLAVSIGLANLLLFSSYVTAVSVIANIDLFRSLVVVGASTLLQQAIGSVAENFVFGALGPMAVSVAAL